MRRLFTTMVSLLLVAGWCCWWLLLPAPTPLEAYAKSGESQGGLSYLPLTEERGRLLPAIWSPTWLPSGPSKVYGATEQERFLSIPMDLASPLKDPAQESAGEVESPLQAPPTNLSAIFERHLLQNLPLPKIVESGPSTSVPVTLQLEVDPPVPDLGAKLPALGKNLPDSSTDWRVRLILNVDKKGVVQQALLDQRSGDPDVDQAVVRWAYQLAVGPGWDREFIRLTVRWSKP